MCEYIVYNKKGDIIARIEADRVAEFPNEEWVYFYKGEELVAKFSRDIIGGWAKSEGNESVGEVV